MSKFNYREGQKVNGLTFINEIQQKKNHRYAIWKCYCGKQFTTKIESVRNGHTKSCGCYHIKQTKIRSITHGLKKHPLYSVYTSMKNRCLNSNNHAFKYYGARGITICDEWQNDIKAFIEWGEKNGYQKGLTIERIDNNKGYCPSNCTFATVAEQSHNRRSTKLDWAKVNEIREMRQGNSKILQREIADIYGVSKATINRVIKNINWII